MTKAPITVIIPVRNEEKNIKECLESVQFCDQVLVIDSGSTDGTEKICQDLGADFVSFEYKGGWPKKRQWAMENLDIRNPWTLLLDADERITDSLQKEMTEISRSDSKISGYYLTLNLVFLGKVLKHGANGLQKMSFFKTGKGNYEMRLEDQDSSMADMEIHEHVIVDGETSHCKNYVIHHNYNTMDRYIHKHNEYSNWESVIYFKHFYKERGFSKTEENLGKQAKFRRKIKHLFFKMPFTPMLFFIYLYVFKLGFLDGKQGFIYCAFQAIQIFHIKVKVFELRLLNKS